MENHQTENNQADTNVDQPSAYVPPRMEKMQKLAEVTGFEKMTGGDEQQPA